MSHDDIEDDAIGGSTDYIASYLTLRAGELSSAVRLIASDARTAANFFTQHYKDTFPDLTIAKALKDRDCIHSKLSDAIHYSRLAAEMEYIRDTRLPLLPASAVCKIGVDKAGYKDFQQAADGHPYSLETLAYSQDWLEGISYGTDRHIPKARINKAAWPYFSTNEGLDVLTGHVDDVIAKGKAAAILRQSPSGSRLLEQAEALGASHNFVDMRLYNFVRQDRGKGLVCALYQQRKILVDTSNGLGSVYRAIKLAHECAHAVQFLRHLGERKHTTPESQRGFYSNVEQYTSSLEAHSIAWEYIVAAELLAAGIDPEEIHSALDYALDSDIIDLITHDPEQFIATVSQSETVRNIWELKPGHMRPSLKLAAEFAKSIGPLCDRWDSLPQPTPPEQVLGGYFLFLKERLADLRSTAPNSFR